MQLKKIESKIHEIRGQKVMLDFDLAELYEVGTKVLNQAVKRNTNRFPADFMFQLTKIEWNSLRLQIETSGTNWSQIVTSSQKHKTKDNRSQFVTGSQKHRNVAYAPFAFTEQGVSMLSSVLKSDKAIDVNIAIMRAFVFMRQYALTHKDLTEKLKEMENKYNKQFKDVYEAINYLLAKDKKETKPTAQENRRQVGFKTNKNNES